MALHGKNFIAGQHSADGNQNFNAINPAIGKTIDPLFMEATDQEVDTALSQADAAYDQITDLTPAQRADFLDAIAIQIEALGDDLIDRASAETALPAARLTGERGRTMNQLNQFAQLVREGSWVEARIDHAIPDRQPLPKVDVRRMLVPIGPVVVFGASNFPLAFSVAGGDTASALAAGCPVIIKAHPAHPGTCELIAMAIERAIERTKVPPAIFSMVHGQGPEVGMAMVKHPLTKAIGFTGSLAAGRAIYNAAAARPEPIPVYAEMGSANPIFVLPSAVTDRGKQIAEALCQSVTLGVGQFCTNPGLVLGLRDKPFDQFIDLCSQHFASAATGTMLHPGIGRNYQSRMNKIKDTSGVDLRAQSLEKQSPTTTCGPAGLFVSDATTFLSNSDLSEEIFGPSTIAIACNDIEQLYESAHHLPGQLTITIHGTEQDLEEFDSLIAILQRKAGRLVFNGFPTGVEVCPSMHHGGPYPATTDARTTSVGTAAIQRFSRPVCYQQFPQSALPVQLRDHNEMEIMRLVDGKWTK